MSSSSDDDGSSDDSDSSIELLPPSKAIGLKHQSSEDSIDIHDDSSSECSSDSSDSESGKKYGSFQNADSEMQQRANKLLELRRQLGMGTEDTALVQSPRKKAVGRSKSAGFYGLAKASSPSRSPTKSKKAPGRSKSSDDPDKLYASLSKSISNLDSKLEARRLEREQKAREAAEKKALERLEDSTRLAKMLDAMGAITEEEREQRKAEAAMRIMAQVEKRRQEDPLSPKKAARNLLAERDKVDWKRKEKQRKEKEEKERQRKKREEEEEAKREKKAAEEAKKKEKAEEERRKKEKAEHERREKEAAKKKAEEEKRRREAEEAEKERKRREQEEAERRRREEEEKVKKLSPEEERRLWKEEMARNAQESLAKATAAAQSNPEGKTMTSEELAAYDGQFYTVEQLMNMSVPGLDYPNREKYLAPEDCMTLFKVVRVEPM